MIAHASRVIALALLAVAGAAASATAQDAAAPPSPPQTYEPKVGQPGKDVVWVPTPTALVETMLDLAKVTKDDVVMDLGSGDGRNIIAAAKRGARARGVEFNPDMVALATRLAREAGVADRATFVQGDMYEADISAATVMAIFLLPENMDRLLPRFQEMRPGTRIVANTFGFTEWDPDARETVKDCSNWCDALLWIVPARVAGTWRLDNGGTLTLTQIHQVIYGTVADTSGTEPVSAARVRGIDVTFTAGGRVYSGRLGNGVMEGTMTTPQGATT
ncbi:MAG: class I SAM-dependent methyltransferase, partial [Acidobacteria bacterium]|nr:class I SAM-dependent methyltransferase [Acidobacteriota bacterium]